MNGKNVYHGKYTYLRNWEEQKFGSGCGNIKPLLVDLCFFIRCLISHP